MENILIAEKDTKPIYETEIHWISLVFPIFKMFLGVIGLFILMFSSSNTFLNIIGIYLCYILIKGILDFLYLKSLKVSLSKTNINVRAGIIVRTIIDTPLNKRENVCLYQTLLGRILNYGTFTISTGGTTLSYTLKKPMELRNQILKQE